MHLGFLQILTIVFIVLKLTEVISWSWWWVFSPLWLGIPVALVLTFVFVFILTVLSGGSGKVQLSRSEQEMADRLGVSYKDYALQKKKLEKKNLNGYTFVFDK